MVSPLAKELEVVSCFDFVSGRHFAMYTYQSGISVCRCIGDNPHKFYMKTCSRNRPFPSSPQPPFQSESKCVVFVMKISFHSY